MLTLIGKTLAKIGDSGGDCDGPDLSVEDICAECRQLNRWSRRAIDWSNKASSRLGAIVGAILKADDDILASLCGNCLLAAPDSPECFLVKLDVLGIDTKATFLVGGDDCFKFGRKVTYTSCGVESCWFEICDYLCETCTERTLDPVNNPEDLALAQKMVQIAQLKNRSINTAPALLEGIKILFENSDPEIVQVLETKVVIYVGRPFTAQEIQQRRFYASLLPLKQGVELVFAEPCQ